MTLRRRRRRLDRGEPGVTAPDDLALLGKELRALRKEMERMRKHQRSVERRQREQLKRVVDILRLVHDDEPAMRRRLYELRRQPDYELAFAEPEPLVSVVIPTFDRAETLAQRSIPSALAQTYANLEVIVVGDAAPPAVAEAVASFADPRITYFNRTYRGPYPDDPRRVRAVAGGPPFNEGAQRARGRWIAPLPDDDAFRPDHVEVLLRAAQRGRYEVCYGKVCRLLPDGTRSELGDAPPDGFCFGQSSLYHTGLRFMEMELADALFREASDKSLYRRMLRAGVRAGFVDAVVTDYHWAPRFEGHMPPSSAPASGKPEPSSDHGRAAST